MMKLSKIEAVELELTAIKHAADVMQSDEVTRRQMVERVYAKHGLPFYALPTDGQVVTHSLTQLLKDREVKLSARKVNKVLVTIGVLEERYRLSRKTGKSKKFLALSEYGEQFGRNLTNKRNVEEVQPHYYDSTFDRLLEAVMAVIANE